MQRKTLYLWALFLVVLCACTDEPDSATMPKTPLAIRLARPDISYHLEAAMKARVDPMFDADALERLLRWIHPDHRKDYLHRFIPQVDGPLVIEKRGKISVIPRISYSIRTDDPILQPLLEDVWAPYWRAFSDEELKAQIVSPFPGLERARQRRSLDAGNDAQKPDR